MNAETTTPMDTAQEYKLSHTETEEQKMPAMTESNDSSERKDGEGEAGVKRDQPTGKKKEPKENKRAKSAKERREHQKKNQTWTADDGDRVSTAVPGEARLPKKKVALLFGYNGANYQGLQLYVQKKSITIAGAIDPILTCRI